VTQDTRQWWQRPLRVVQPNLQVRDTAKIDPERLAAQLQEMHANTVVFNVGGIYGWYPSDVPYHHVNEYLPKDTDLLRDVIEACHRKDIRFVARFDFSKAADAVYQRKPQWFVRKGDRPETIGSMRPGEWSLLMSTCVNGAYRGEAVALPVLGEVLDRYDIDGIFFNNPGFRACDCDNCRRKYRETYGMDLPSSATPELYEPDWASRSMRDNTEAMYRFIKQKNADVPMILYYNLYKDNLFDRERTADMLCTEPMDILSLGHRAIPEFWKPALSIKLGRSLPERPAPFGIVHSCPGMDWRHTSLPPAEYRFWLAQIPAHGGSVWHSLTGVPDTIPDKRIVRIVSELNENVKKTEAYMDGATPYSQVALLWNAAPSAEGWADGLIHGQIPFDMLLPEQADAARLSAYRAVVVPEGYEWTEPFAAAALEYARAGGCIVAEGTIPLDRYGLAGAFGVSARTQLSEPLAASYLRFEGEPASNPLQRELEETELIAHRGRVVYCEPAGAETLATLVPPFSPLDSVGAPPERASMLVDRTDLPLALDAKHGAGRIVYFPFSLSGLLTEYRLAEHYTLLRNAVDYAVGAEKAVRVTPIAGLQTTAFRKDGELLLHFVNGVGRRPLGTTIPLRGIEAELRLPDGAKVVSARELLSGEELAVVRDGAAARFTLPELGVWECVRVTTE